MAIKNQFLLPLLIAGLASILTGQVSAQAFKTLYSFSSAPDYTNSDGLYPTGGLILSGNTLYGTAADGGTNGTGTVFAVNTSGSNITTLHTFAAYDYGTYTNSDGVYPNGGLILSGKTFYGTTEQEGPNGSGTLFAINTNGTNFTDLYTNLYSFDDEDSGDAGPLAGLIVSGSTLYGTTANCGAYYSGSVFAINTNGMGFMYLYSFTPGSGLDDTNSGGLAPDARLILSGNTLYGKASYGGTYGRGTVFAVNINEMSLTTLHSFSAVATNDLGVYTNSDGFDPTGGLILSGNTLYGTAGNGGTCGNGTVFAVNINDMSLTILHRFTAEATNQFGIYTNSDGAEPGGLVLSGNTLYGTADRGGSSGFGTVFALNINDMSLITLHSFAAVAANDLGAYTNSDGFDPSDGLILSSNTLYGTAAAGGEYGSGTVFSISLPPVAGTPKLAIIHSGTNVILTWPTNVIGFTLQSATNLVSTTVWTTVSPSPVVVNANNIVTNGISGTKKFFRLSQ